MADESKAVEIVVCLGSSCFARGNSQHLAAIEAYLAGHGLQSSVRLAGCLCQDECKQGPNLVVRGEHIHQINPAKLREILLALNARTG
ncbi:MAG TPA: (2Fe-2S) ferredoxin domain-containing protein [Terracidiphilus sp.]|nr:(2Fe-2S) ferredoxin domain-containing protein [Terracidiphilus sp.]